MKFGLFMMPVHHPSKGLPRTIQEDMNTVIKADALGLDEAWIGEHFTIPWENLPAPDLFIAQAFARTQNIKLGTGVVLLQLHDPRDLAHRIAMLDHLSDGRFYFGVGTGGVPTEFELFEVDEEKRHARAAEVVDAVLKIWESDGTLDYQGEFHQFKSPSPVAPEVGLGLWLKPATLPHPPIAVAGVSRNSSTIEWGRGKRMDPPDHGYTAAGVHPHSLGGVHQGRRQDRQGGRPSRLAGLREYACGGDHRGGPQASAGAWHGPHLQRILLPAVSDPGVLQHD